jgi:hypothetical protein
LCPTYNGHSAPKLEQAILEYLGQFSDPEVVQGLMAAAERKVMEEHQVELHGVQQGLTDLESQFLKHLGLLKRGVLN